MLKLKEDKPVFLARVGRNVLYPDVMTVVPEGELTVKMTTAATFSPLIYYVTCISSFNPLNNTEAAQVLVILNLGKHSGHTLQVQISVLPLCDLDQIT